MHRSPNTNCKEVRYHLNYHVQLTNLLEDLRHYIGWPVARNWFFHFRFLQSTRCIFLPNHLHNFCYHDFLIQKFLLYKIQDRRTWHPQWQNHHRSVPKFLLCLDPYKGVFQLIALIRLSDLLKYYLPYFRSRHREKI